MKMGVLILLVMVVSMSYVIAADCELNVKLLNQDPYPAMPDDYVKVVFQMTGVENPKCGELTFQLNELYPFSLDPDVDSRLLIMGGTFNKDYKNYWVIPFRVRVDKNALDGENELGVSYFSSGEERANRIESFNITVNDVRTDFEVYVKDYDVNTNIVTFEVLNIGEHDAEALTIEIPRQENIRIKGGNRNIVGDLDANDDTTFTYEATPIDGEIKVNVIYTDEISVRRELEKTLDYDSYYFTGRKRDEVAPVSKAYYIGVGIVLVVVILWVRSELKRRRKKKEREKLFHERTHDNHKGKRKK